jgi:hypothetical protein
VLNLEERERPHKAKSVEFDGPDLQVPPNRLLRRDVDEMLVANGPTRRLLDHLLVLRIASVAA